tara:strand:+ start:1144 stop:1275 length:132 start_codon:yes stop_codon:yes gene_type:complete
MISDREVVNRVAKRLRRGKNMTQEQAKKEIAKIKRRIERKKGE